MMMLVNRMARRVFGVEVAGHEEQHRANHQHRQHEHQFLRKRQTAERDGKDEQPEADAAAENAPVERPPLARFRPDQQYSQDRERGNDEAEKKYRFTGKELGEPSR